MKPSPKAIEAASEIHGDLSLTRMQKAEIIQAAMDEAVKPYKDALEELADWQNGPPLLSQKWLDGWNDAMAKAWELTGAGQWKRIER